jgi:hypothetical protein
VCHYTGISNRKTHPPDISQVLACCPCHGTVDTSLIHALAPQLVLLNKKGCPTLEQPFW